MRLRLRRGIRSTTNRQEDRDVELGVEGRNFVLVGGTTGMGFAAAEQLVREGANVALLARDGARATAKADELAATHGVRVDDAASALGPLRRLAVTAGPIKSRAVVVSCRPSACIIQRRFPPWPTKPPIRWSWSTWTRGHG